MRFLQYKLASATRTGKRYRATYVVESGADIMKTGLLHRAGRGLKPFGWASVVAAPLVTHVSIATGRFGALAAALAVLEVGALATVTLLPLRGWQRAAGAVVAASLMILLGLRLLHPAWAGTTGLIAASAVSHTVIYLSLLILFGRSLQPGHTALITGLAARLRGALSPAIVAYTRTVTKAWCVFFALQLATSATLLACAPDRVWSLFANVLDGPLVLLMFAGEYAIRRWRFRDERHISPAETIRSFARSRAAGP